MIVDIVVVIAVKYYYIIIPSIRIIIIIIVIYPLVCRTTIVAKGGGEGEDAAGHRPVLSAAAVAGTGRKFIKTDRRHDIRGRFALLRVDVSNDNLR